MKFSNGPWSVCPGIYAWWFFIGTVMFINSTGLARAALILSLGNPTLVEGGVADINVQLSSNDLLNPRNIASFDLTLTITNASNPGSLMTFVAPPDNGFGASNYIFAGTTTSPLLSLSPGTPQIARISDFLVSGFVSVANPVSLGRLRIAGDPFATPVAGNVFQIELTGTSFFNEAFSSLPFSATGTTIAIAIPEPNSMALVGGMMLVGRVAIRRRSKRLLFSQGTTGQLLF